MRVLALLLVFLVACCVRGPVDVRNAAELAEARSVTLLDGDGDALCGGIWVAQARILTAAHCVSGLGRGASIVEAQRTAKLALLAVPATRHPYYWASLIVSGAADRKIK